MKPPFVIFGLPRSRTYWLSRFLSYDGRVCDHDPSRFFRTRADVGAYFNRPLAAAVDTALGLIWADVKDALPDNLRVAVVHRSQRAVAASLEAIGAPVPDLGAFAAKLEQIGGEHFEFDELNREAQARAMFEWCLDRPFDRAWWMGLRDVRLECNKAAYVRDVERNLAGVRAVFAT